MKKVLITAKRNVPFGITKLGIKVDVSDRDATVDRLRSVGYVGFKVEYVSRPEH